MKKSRLISLAIVALSVAAVAVAILSATGPGEDPPSSAEQPVQRYAVRVATVDEATIEAKTKLNGEVVPRVSVEALPDVAGTVRDITVDIGDRVSPGEVLAYVDPSRPGTRFQASPITAPIAGTVTNLYVDVGSTVGQTTPVLRIGTLEALEIVVDIPERFVGAVDRGTTGTVVFSAFPDSPRQAQVARLSPILDASSRSKEAAFVLESPWDAVQPGMFAEITLATDRRADALTVPLDSIVTRSNLESVFVVEENVVRLVSVETGISADGKIEILAGLSPGQRVVVEGQSLLEDGSPIKVVSGAEEDGA